MSWQSLTYSLNMPPHTGCITQKPAFTLCGCWFDDINECHSPPVVYASVFLAAFVVACGMSWRHVLQHFMHWVWRKWMDFRTIRNERMRVWIEQFQMTSSPLSQWSFLYNSANKCTIPIGIKATIYCKLMNFLLVHSFGPNILPRWCKFEWKGLMSRRERGIFYDNMIYNFVPLQRGVMQAQTTV